MDVGQLTAQLSANPVRIQSLAENVSPDQARWRPDPESWSILEVINHLYDEEREDFRVRLDIILHHPDQEWPRIDPEGWVVERKYNQRDLKESLDNFLKERKASLEWLNGLASPNWEAVYQTKFGPIRAGDIFASWVAHDLLHMRQLVELHRAYTLVLAGPYQTDYAGPW